jgi:hypothetical protein
MSVTFGPEVAPVKDDLIGRKDALVVLNLTPGGLDGMGGF